MKCACIALLVFFFIVFGAGTPYIVYRNTGTNETVPDANSTEPVGNGATTTGMTTNGTATTNGSNTTTNSTSLSGGSTRRALAACPQTDSDALLLLATEDGDGTVTCTYASGACTYHSDTGVLLDDQNAGSCPSSANFKDRTRKSRCGTRYEAIAKRFLA